MHVPFRVALPVLLQLGTAAAAADYQAAKDLYDQGEIAKARAAFSGVLGDHAQSAKNRAAAARGLARIDWLIDGNADAATTQLQEALTIGAEQCETQIYLARVLRESGRFSDAVSAARDLSSCIERPNRDELLTERAHASLALNDLADAERSLGPVSRVGALAPPVNALKLQAALLRRTFSSRPFGMARLFLVELFRRPPGLREGAGTRDLSFRRGKRRIGTCSMPVAQSPHPRGLRRGCRKLCG